MKHFNIVLFLFLASQSVVGQSLSWNLFPLHQKSWWRSQNDLKVYYCDSVETLGTERYLYFGLKYIQEPFKDCFADLQKENKAFAEKIPYDLWKPVKVESGQWTWQKSSKPQFYDNSAIGDHWRFRTTTDKNGFDEIEIVHVGNDSISLFGIKTAARQFRVRPYKNSVLVNNAFTNAELMLTEKFGFVRYLPLDLLSEGTIPEMQTLVGCRQGADNFGLVPDYASFMSNYKIGNVYKWQTISFSYISNTETTAYHLDSLLEVKATAQDITLRSYRKTLTIKQKKGAGGVILSTDSSYTVDPKYIRVLVREQLEPCINGVPGWLHESKSRYVQDKTLMYSAGKFDDVEALHMRAETQLGIFLPKDCEIGLLTDIHEVVGAHSACGYSEYRAEYISGYYYELLLGCRNGSKVWGDIVPPTKLALHDPIQVRHFSLYPSLTDGPILGSDISQWADFDENVTLSVHDSAGRMVYCNPRFTNGQWPDLSAYPAGLYLLSIRSDRFVALGKVLKQ